MTPEQAMRTIKKIKTKDAETTKALKMGYFAIARLSIAQKPTGIVKCPNGKLDEWMSEPSCPKCKLLLDYDEGRCPKCGQLLDWSDIDG